LTEVDDLIQEGLMTATIEFRKYDPSRSGDIQKFVRTRASYHMKAVARKWAERRDKEMSLLVEAVPITCRRGRR